jgi:mannonate dehydratase
MASIGWFRTDAHVAARGGAMTNRFQLRAVANDPLPPDQCVTEEQLWENYQVFLENVLPAAEAAGVRMGLHPDDPPLSPVRGVGRIFTSAAAFDRAMALSDSPSHGITFCQANFLAMGEDLTATSRRFADRIAFVHFRDIEGTREDFTETFHDNGPTDMARMLEIYSRNGFAGPMRPDHAPTMEGERNDRPGYAMTGKVFAFGYMKGVLDGLRLPYE